MLIGLDHITFNYSKFKVNNKYQKIFAFKNANNNIQKKNLLDIIGKSMKYIFMQQSQVN